MYEADKVDKNSFKRPRLDWQWSLKKRVKNYVAVEVETDKVDKNSFKRPRLDWQGSLKKHVKNSVVVEVDEENDNHIRRRWEELDNDILVSIMNRLPERNLIFSICFVCKSWLNAALDTLFPPQDVFNMRIFSYMDTSHRTYFRRLFNMFVLHLKRDQQKHYTKLVLSNVFFQNGYRFIATRLPSIRSVTLSYIGWQKLYRFKNFASCWKGLVEVECNASCAELVGETWNQIHTLRLEGEVKVEDAIGIARNFPCLTHLSLRYCTLKDNALSLILESHKNLTYLDLSKARLLEKNVYKDWDEDFLLKVSATITQFVRCEMRRCDKRDCRFCYRKYPLL